VILTERMDVRGCSARLHHSALGPVRQKLDAIAKTQSSALLQPRLPFDSIFTFATDIQDAVGKHPQDHVQGAHGNEGAEEFLMFWSMC